MRRHSPVARGQRGAKRQPVMFCSWRRLGICSGMTWSTRRPALSEGLASCKQRV